MRSKQQPRPSYRWVNKDENGKCPILLLESNLFQFKGLLKSAYRGLETNDDKTNHLFVYLFRSTSFFVYFFKKVAFQISGNLSPDINSTLKSDNIFFILNVIYDFPFDLKFFYACAYTIGGIIAVEKWLKKSWENIKHFVSINRMDLNLFDANPFIFCVCACITMTDTN